MLTNIALAPPPPPLAAMIAPAAIDTLGDSIATMPPAPPPPPPTAELELAALPARAPPARTCAPIPSATDVLPASSTAPPPEPPAAVVFLSDGALTAGSGPALPLFAPTHPPRSTFDTPAIAMPPGPPGFWALVSPGPPLPPPAANAPPPPPPEPPPLSTSSLPTVAPAGGSHAGLAPAPSPPARVLLASITAFMSSATPVHAAIISGLPPVSRSVAPGSR